MATLEKLKLAFIDDHRLFRKGLISLLELSYPDLNIVFEADDGNKMKNMISGSNLPDIIIMDINMPGMSGLDLLHHIKERYENPPPVVMMITAYGDAENFNKAMELGADDFLTKPLDFNILKEKLKLN